MAKPIRNTPILIGRDAEIFREELSIIPSKEARMKERQRIRENVEKLKMMISRLPQ